MNVERPQTTLCRRSDGPLVGIAPRFLQGADAAAIGGQMLESIR